MSSQNIDKKKILPTHLIEKKKDSSLDLKKASLIYRNKIDSKESLTGKILSSPNLKNYSRAHEKSQMSSNSSANELDEDIFNIINDSYMNANSSLEYILWKMINLVEAEAASLSLLEEIPNKSFYDSQKSLNININSNSITTNTTTDPTTSTSTSTTTNTNTTTTTTTDTNPTTTNPITSTNNHSYTENIQQPGLLLRKSNYQLRLFAHIIRNERSEKDTFESKKYKKYKNVKVKKVKPDCFLRINENRSFCCEIAQSNKPIIENNSKIIEKRSWLDLYGNERQLNMKEELNKVQNKPEQIGNEKSDNKSNATSNRNSNNKSNSSYIKNYIGIPIVFFGEEKSLPWMAEKHYNNVLGVICLYNKIGYSGSKSHGSINESLFQSSASRNSTSHSSLTYEGIFTQQDLQKIKKYQKYASIVIQNNNIFKDYTKYKCIEENRIKKILENEIEFENEIKLGSFINIDEIQPQMENGDIEEGDKKENEKTFENQGKEKNDEDKSKVKNLKNSNINNNNNAKSDIDINKNNVKEENHLNKKVAEITKTSMTGSLSNFNSNAALMSSSNAASTSNRNILNTNIMKLQNTVNNNNTTTINQNNNLKNFDSYQDFACSSQILNGTNKEIEMKLLKIKKENFYYKSIHEELLTKMKELAEKNDILNEQLNRNKVILQLLDILQSLFSEFNYHSLLKKIVISARELIGADQASLFMVQENNILRSEVFNTGVEECVELPVGKGLIGCVAQTGTLLNIPDAYLDDRFNDAVDIEHKYRTKSMLIIPIFSSSQISNESDGIIDGNKSYSGYHYYNSTTLNNDGDNENKDTKKVIGVMNLINKLGPNGETDVFSDFDVIVMQSFAVYCALSLERAILLQHNQKQQTIMDVNVEMIAYHMTMPREDVENFYNKYLGNNDKSKIIIDPNLYQNWDFDPHCLKDQMDELILVIYSMFQEYNFTKHLHISEKMLIQFIMTINKNYRVNVKYHNFTHAAAVTHTLYLLMKFGGLKELLNDDFDTLVMFVACLCHDIDHRGTNNQFQVSAKTILAAESIDSTMERHHFNHTINILTLPEHNIFKNLSKQQYIRALNILEKCIIATDLSIFFKNLKDTTELVTKTPQGCIDIKNNQRNWELVHGLVMTSCDFGSMIKPFEKARKVAEDVLTESFEQGEKEKELGLPFSSSLMDRSATEKKIPHVQYEFFNNVIEPAISLLEKLLPKAKPMLDGVQRNKAIWKSLMENNVEYTLGSNIE